MLKTVISSLFEGLAASALFVIPFLGIAVWLRHRQKKFKSEALEPFTELPLRPPGESLRLKIDELSTEFDSTVTVAAMIGIGAAAYAISMPAAHRASNGVALLVVVFGCYVHCAIQLGKLQRQLWMYRLGFTGERVVGEELNQLLTSGFKVFHDVPFEGFNIDHVLVGPPGVFAVETKARRKSADIKGLERARVYSDGAQLRFPKRIDTTSIPQARRNAATLSKWLTSATGEAVAASPILTFPGWAVIREGTSDVNVLRPDEIKRSFRGDASLSPDQIKRIAHQLTERCRIQVPKG